MSSGTYLEDFLQYLRVERQMSPHTLRNYGLDISQFLDFLQESREGRPGGGHLPGPAGLSGHSLKGAAQVHGGPEALGPAHLFQVFAAPGRVAVNQAKLAPSPKLEKTLPHFLTVDEAFHLLGQLSGDDFGACRDRAILEVFYGGGLRLSELAGLNLGGSGPEGRGAAGLGQGRQGAPGLLGQAAKEGLKAYLPLRQAASGAHQAPGQTALFVNRGRPLKHPLGGPAGGQVGAGWRACPRP